jgi:hypothetical protein
MAPSEVRPYVVAEMGYRCRDIGYGVEYGAVTGYFTGEVDTWGKMTFALVDPILMGNQAQLYLFGDEVEVVEYLDEVSA